MALSELAGKAIGGAFKLGGSILGAIGTARKMRKVRKNLKKQMAENQAWYNQRYNEDATQRADAQRVLTQTMDAIKNRNRGAQGTAAVMGGTTEGVAAAQAEQAEMLGNTMSGINQSAEVRKDAVENTYLNRKDTLNNKMNELTMQQAQNIQQTTQDVVDTGARMFQMPTPKQ